MYAMLFRGKWKEGSKEQKRRNYQTQLDMYETTVPIKVGRFLFSLSLWTRNTLHALHIIRLLTYMYCLYVLVYSFGRNFDTKVVETVIFCRRIAEAIHPMLFVCKCFFSSSSKMDWTVGIGRQGFGNDACRQKLGSVGWTKWRKKKWKLNFRFTWDHTYIYKQ